MMEYLYDTLRAIESQPLRESLVVGYIAILESSLADMPIRECTRDEMVRSVVQACHDVFKEMLCSVVQACPDVSNAGLIDKNEIANTYRVYVDMYTRHWKHALHTYTIDGNQCFMLEKPRRTTDGRNYLSLAYVNPEARGTGIAARLLKRCMDDSPNGLALHTQRSNVAMIGLAKKLGFVVEQYGYNVVCTYSPNDELPTG